VAQGLSIVGYFHANERFDDVELCGVAKNIGDHISRYFPQAPILLVSKCLILCLWNALARQEAKGCEYPVFRASLRLMLRSPKSKCSSISPVFFRIYHVNIFTLTNYPALFFFHHISFASLYQLLFQA
jgi:hypothetical protein